MEPLDSLAFIGLNPSSFDQESKNNNVYIATGDSGNGITHCTISWNIIIRSNIGKKK